MDSIQERIAIAIEERARGVSRLIRHPDQQPLCSGEEHDDRWCTDCDRMALGMELAAEIARNFKVGSLRPYLEESFKSRE